MSEVSVGSAITRIIALKTAHPNTNNLRLMVGDAEAIELVGELSDAGDALKAAAEALKTDMATAGPSPDKGRVFMDWVASRAKLRSALWDLLEGRLVNGVEVLEAR